MEEDSMEDLTECTKERRTYEFCCINNVVLLCFDEHLLQSKYGSGLGGG